jgi:hypothetical protein
MAAAAPAVAYDAGVRAAVRVENAHVKLSPQIRRVLATSKVANGAILSVVQGAAALETRLGHAATAVTKTVAESPIIEQGRRDWLTGARQLENGLGSLVIALRDAERGLDTRARAAFHAAVRNIDAAESLMRHADRELRVPVSS